MNPEKQEAAVNGVLEAFSDLEAHIERLERSRVEACNALRWVSINAQFTADLPEDGALRVKQIYARAEQALSDVYAIYDGKL